MLSRFKLTFIAFFRKLRPVIFGMGFILLFMVLSISSYALYDSLKGTETYNEGASITEIDTPQDCNVAGIEVHGEIVTYIPPMAEGQEPTADMVASEYIAYRIDKAEKDDTVKAIVVEIDSYGGFPVAAEEIANALKRAKKPVVALIREAGVSAAYWAATGASRIFASKNSDVGSIGVTGSYTENNNKDLKFVDLSVGKFKDAGNPDKPLTSEEKELILRNLKIIHENFIQEVAERRKISVEKVRALADGSSVLGVRAKELGLIDEIGGIFEVKDYLKKQIGEEVEVCW